MTDLKPTRATALFLSIMERRDHHHGKREKVHFTLRGARTAVEQATLLGPLDGAAAIYGRWKGDWELIHEIEDGTLRGDLPW